MRQSVLVPLDFGREADRALPIAESLARRLGTRLDVVSITSPGIDPQQDMADARAHARAMGVERGQRAGRRAVLRHPRPPPAG